ncbi:MAG: Gfo/Idh/MocA family oxidoreductase [Comamonadaceae bacterium]|nr:Gfo/Idh/MocA family oxidoreductase [Comamonadaceae bacterium]
MSHVRSISRRHFIRTGAAAAAALTIVPRRVLGGPGYLAPSDTLTKAVVGVGGMGQGHLGYEGSVLRAVCDVDRGHLASALEIAGPGVDGYTDFREVLARPDIDIVHIATPPHWHALISIAAAEAGKDVWCEKPMTRTIAEGRAVAEAVRRTGRVFRINTWFRFTDRFYGFGTDVRPIKKVVANRAPGLAAQGDGQRDDGLRLEVLLERPRPRPARARAAGSRLRLLARPGALEALPSPPRPRHVPRLLGLRRRRPRRHGHALPGPGAVPAREGRHQPGRDRGRLPAAAPRRLRRLAPRRDEIRRRLRHRPRRREPGHLGALPRRPEGKALPRASSPISRTSARRSRPCPIRSPRSRTSPSPSGPGAPSPSTSGTATAPARSSTWPRSPSSSAGP